MAWRGCQGLQHFQNSGSGSNSLSPELAVGLASADRAGGEDRVSTLTAGEAWSFDDVARALGELSGKSVTYNPTDKATFEARMRGRGAPEMMTGVFHGFCCDIRDGQLDEVTPEREGLLGRKPASLQAGLKGLFNL